MGHMLTLTNNTKGLIITPSIPLHAFAEALQKKAMRDKNAVLKIETSFVYIESPQQDIELIRLQSGYEPNISILSSSSSAEMIEIEPKTVLQFKTQTHAHSFYSTANGTLFQWPKTAPLQQIEDIEKKLKQAQTQDERMAKWLLEGEVGQSSLSLAYLLYFSDHPINDNAILQGWPTLEIEKNMKKDATPSDSSDWARCFKLLEACPELKDNLARLQHNEKWAALLPQWNSAEQLFLTKTKQKI